MIIRKYRNYPTAYTADLGEIIEARLSTVYPFTRAVVVKVKRARGGAIRYDFVWRETREEIDVVEGKRSHVYTHPQGDVPPLIRQISKGTPPVV